MAVGAAGEVDRAGRAGRRAGGRRAAVIATAAEAGRAVTVGEASGLAGLGPIAAASYRIADRRPRLGARDAHIATIGIGGTGLRGRETDAAKRRRAWNNARRAEPAVGSRPARSIEAARAGVRGRVRRASAPGRRATSAAGQRDVAAGRVPFPARPMSAQTGRPERLRTAARIESNGSYQKQKGDSDQRHVREIVRRPASNHLRVRPPDDAPIGGRSQALD
jgi:hypothetical protein